MGTGRRWQGRRRYWVSTRRCDVEKIVRDWDTVVKMSGDEAQSVCKLGKGAECCAFLVCGPAGFQCIRMAYPTNASIFTRLKDGTMNAKGEGGWDGCAWSEELRDDSI